MTRLLYTLGAVAVILLAVDAAKDDGSAVRAKRSIGLSPSSFGEKKRERERRAIQPRSQAVMGRPGGSESDYLKLTVTRCKEEGMVFIPGDDSYFLKCQLNPKTGGFFQIIYICPNGIRSPSDTTKCIPPPDCDECEGMESQIFQ